jgi:hypothetical protein
MPLTIYLRPKLESLSTEELMSLQADTIAHLESLAEADPVRIKGEGILDTILDVLAKRLDNEVVVRELNRMFTL